MSSVKGSVLQSATCSATERCAAGVSAPVAVGLSTVHVQHLAHARSRTQLDNITATSHHRFERTARSLACPAHRNRLHDKVLDLCSPEDRSGLASFGMHPAIRTSSPSASPQHLDHVSVWAPQAALQTLLYPGFRTIYQG